MQLIFKHNQYATNYDFLYSLLERRFQNTNRDYQPKFIKMIIKQGMPVDIKDKKQLTPMHHAISGF